jgi:hypothetical protein
MKSSLHSLIRFLPLFSITANSLNSLLQLPTPELDSVFLTTASYLNSNSSQSQGQNYVTADGQSASLSWFQAHVWDLRPDFYFCLTAADLLMWGALSDERTGLSFTMYDIQYTTYLHFTCYCMNVYTIYTRPLSVQAQ